MIEPIRMRPLKSNWMRITNWGKGLPVWMWKYKVKQLLWLLKQEERGCRKRNNPSKSS